MTISSTNASKAINRPRISSSSFMSASGQLGGSRLQLYRPAGSYLAHASIPPQQPHQSGLIQPARACGAQERPAQHAAHPAHGEHACRQAQQHHDFST